MLKFLISFVMIYISMIPISLLSYPRQLLLTPEEYNAKMNVVYQHCDQEREQRNTIHHAILLLIKSSTTSDYDTRIRECIDTLNKLPWCHWESLHNMVDETDEQKKTILHYAVLKNDAALMRNLLENMHINDFDEIARQDIHGKTALHYALEQRRFAMAKLMIHLCAPRANSSQLSSSRKLRHNIINVPDSDGNTPLHYAVNEGNIEIIQALIDEEASSLIENNDSETPRKIAEKKLIRAQNKGNVKKTAWYTRILGLLPQPTVFDDNLCLLNMDDSF